jgi:membrane-bound serine protease (ClpP class)
MTSASMLWAAALYAAPAPVVVLTLEGAVSPATADYVVRGIRKAADQSASLVVLQIDTPGGLDTSMRSIIKEILASPVPVAAFVAPRGARAASAGTYILYASHIAAMAPATNLGAATPVQIGGPPSPAPDKSPAKSWSRAKDKKDGKQQAKEKEQDAPNPKDTLTHKQIQDAAAYIRGLAQLRGRNAKWAEEAVREAVSLSAEEARKQHVIDIVAEDVSDLLVKLNGRKVNVQGVDRMLETDGATLVTVAPDWRTRVLAVITDPSVALILMMLGIYGLLFEFSNPGFVLPGVAGAICVLLALFAFQMLPINYAGLALIVVGLAFIVAEAFMPSFGSLGIGGTIAIVIGAVILIDPDAAPGYSIPLPFIAMLAAVSAAIVFFMVTMALRARGRPVVSGRENIVGARGEALENFTGEGWVRVQSETWRARSATPLTRGQRIRVTRIDGLTLSVDPERPVEHRDNA